ncbi:MAG: hypothetical protein P4L82_03560 [Ancalomicrobiaceae bacterium]|nr:hypothetical protein [Ancalomicrobiaceae bacterium]
MLLLLLALLFQLLPAAQLFGSQRRSLLGDHDRPGIGRCRYDTLDIGHARHQ